MSAVDRFAYRGDQLDPQTVDVDSESFVEGDVGNRLGLTHRHAGVLLGDATGVDAQHVEPDAGGPHSQVADAGVVGLASLVVGLGQVGGFRLLEQIDAANVVHVALRRHDVVRGPGPDSVEDPLVVRRLESHAGVDDHPPAVGEEQVGGGGSTRAEDGRR